jgi:hypothetical protein
MKSQPDPTLGVIAVRFSAATQLALDNIFRLLALQEQNEFLSENLKQCRVSGRESEWGRKRERERERERTK